MAEYIKYHTPLTIGAHALPSFHTLGFVVQVLSGMYSLVRIGLYPPIASRPFATPMMPTPDNILDHITRSRSNALVIIPALLQVWAQDKSAVDVLAGLEFVVRDLSNFERFLLDAVLIWPSAGILWRCPSLQTWQLYDRIRCLCCCHLRSYRVWCSFTLLPGP